MPWVLAVAETAPMVSATEVVQFILEVVNVGFLGIVFWLFVKGRLHSDSEVGHLAAESKRLEDRAVKAEEQRDEAAQFARDHLVPLLQSFVASSGALIPLLQELVRYRDPPALPRERERH